MKGAARQYTLAVPWPLCLAGVLIIGTVEWKLQDTVAVGAVSTGMMRLLSGSGGFMRYVVSPQNGITLYLPFFVLCHYILLGREQTGQVYVKLRLRPCAVRLRPILFAAFTGTGMVVFLLFCGAKGIFFGSVWHDGCCPLGLLVAAMAAKWMYFTILSLLLRFLVVIGIPDEVSCVLMLVLCVVDYALSYTKVYRCGVLIQYAFTEMESLDAWLHLGSWLIGTSLLVWFAGYREACAWRCR